MKTRSAGILCAAGTILALGAAEGALRAAGYSYPSFTRPDSLTGMSLIPLSEGRFTEEGEANLRINSDGWRDERDYVKPKPAGIARVAVLGDSFTQAAQVPTQRTFWTLLESRLNACHAFAGKRVEVLNFGVNGYGTGQEYLLLRDRIKAYAPDLVVLALFTNNDIQDNSKTLSEFQLRPFFRFQGSRLTLDRSFQNGWRYRFHASPAGAVLRAARRHVRLIQLLYQARGGLRSAQRGYHSNKNPLLNSQGINAPIYLEPKTPPWKEAWRITEALIRLMHAEARGQMARFIVVSLSNPIQAHPDRMVREAATTRLGLRDLFYPERRLKAFGRRAGIEVLPMAPDMQSYAQRHRVYLHGFEKSGWGTGHWNASGHAVAGHLIAQHLCRR